MNSSATLSSILQQIDNVDTDLRNQALRDLKTELVKDTLALTDFQQDQLSAKLCERIRDISPAVREMVLECVGPLVKKLKEGKTLGLIENIFNLLFEEKKEEEVSGICVLNIVAEIPDPSGTSLVQSVLPRTLNYLKNPSGSTEVKLILLQLLDALLGRFVHVNALFSELQTVTSVVFLQLDGGPNKNRRKAAEVLGHFSKHVSDKQLKKLVEELLPKMKSSRGEPARTYVQSFNYIAGAVGPKVGPWIEEAIPILILRCNDAMEGEEELRENCLQAFATLLLKCPRDVRGSIDKIRDLVLQLVKWDPNYAGGEDEDMHDINGEEDSKMDEADGDDWNNDNDGDDDFGIAQGEEDEEETGNIEQVEDDSWKVRLAAAKVLAALFSTRPELLTTMYGDVTSVLILRIKEREEQVQIEVLATLETLLRQTYIATKGKGTVEGLERQAPALVQQVCQVNSIKSMNSSFKLLRVLMTVSKCLENQSQHIIPFLKRALSPTSLPPLKLGGLLFLEQYLALHNPARFRDSIVELTQLAFPLVEEIALSAAALKVCKEIAKVFAALSDDRTKPTVLKLYNIVYVKLGEQDLDQTVKEAAIAAATQILVGLSDSVGNKESLAMLKMIETKLDQELTRFTAVEAIKDIASSSSHIPINADYVIPVISKFLKYNDRSLKVHSLIALNAIATKYAKEIAERNPALVETILSQGSHLISSEDVYCAQLMIDLTISIVKISPKTVAKEIPKSIHKQVTNLLASPVLKGSCLNSVLNYYEEIAATKAKEFKFSDLSTNLKGLIKQETQQQILSNIAQCLAVLILSPSNSKEDRTSYIKTSIDDVKNNSTDRGFSLYCLGEIGRRFDLSESKDVLLSTVINCFQSDNDAIQAAASFALGNIAAGNISTFLPEILSKLNETHSQYPYLSAVRDTIASVSHDKEQLAPYVNDIVPVLFKNCDSEDPGTRTVVSECLGRLAQITGKTTIEEMRRRIKEDSPAVRMAVISAICFCISEKTDPEMDKLLQYPTIAEFMSLLTDSDINVRTACIRTFKFLLQKRPGLLRDQLSSYLPHIYKDTIVKPELIEKRKMGIFDITLDNGLLLRKASFECLDTLLQTAFDKLELDVFVKHAVPGVADPSYNIRTLYNPLPGYQIKLLAHSLIRRLSRWCGAVLISEIDTLAKSLEETIKQNIPERDKSRIEDLIKSAIRTIVALKQIPGSEGSVVLLQVLQSFDCLPDGFAKNEWGRVSEKITNTGLSDSNNEDILRGSTGLSLRQSMQ